MIKKYKNYKIKAVNGFLIRNFLDIDFGILHRFSPNVAEFSKKCYIPQSEIWVDAPFLKEIDFLLKIEFFDSYQAEKKFPKFKVREILKKVFCEKGPLPEFRRKKTRKGKYDIVFVDGKTVRKFIDPEFIFGGHSLVYDYIPKNEIWIDSAADKNEIPFILEHEIFESELMKSGKKYDCAHEYANAKEKELRFEKIGASYPGFESYPFTKFSNRKLAEKFYA